ncbi:hypothetical protein llg_33930 [Luteolibacter sp. LG18]|nr:hypothetical protein llg_33930 [Luteolibacter sp. LG18]
MIEFEQWVSSRLMIPNLPGQAGKQAENRTTNDNTFGQVSEEIPLWEKSTFTAATPVPPAPGSRLP